ncbi:GGDEF domain-containing protein [Ralstonia soli]|uniref:diguanylate cyclase n=1 Tax=Ralstonia soli TaxID=2953896 RepID=A0ABT1AM77_9RALS|nr:GGDEF domain-containing protein [Ralstonia soli]MCO5399406.1 GGDEF domain-containing protein [Ralstonia soli]
MGAACGETLSHDLERLLTRALAGLDAGESHRARALAQSALGLAKAAADTAMEARALACLAYCDRLAFRLQRAADTSQRAVHLFQATGDIAGEIDALNTLAHTSIMLGRDIEALEAALLGVKLAEQHGSPHQLALAFNCLGVVCAWGGYFSEADDACARACEVARHCAPIRSAYQPCLNRAFAEQLRLAKGRYEAGHQPDLERLDQLVGEYRRMEEGGAATFLASGFGLMGPVMSCVIAGFLACWRGDASTADAELRAARASLGKLGFTLWLNAYADWLEAEIACVRQDWTAAQALVTRMTAASDKRAHEQLSRMGYLLLHHIHERQGLEALAGQALRQLWCLERRVRADNLASRARVVGWQLTARQSEAELLELKMNSRQFERWSFEDALTRIANRRCLEQNLSNALRLASDLGQAVSIAFIDVDGFKAINDRFGHAVGDRVLSALASILSAQVREDDLPARLAGDEFVVLFTRTDCALAAQICLRIVCAVRDFDWEAISPGLRVSISLGVAQAEAGDSVDALLHRGDLAMYLDKKDAMHTHRFLRMSDTHATHGDDRRELDGPRRARARHRSEAHVGL